MSIATTDIDLVCTDEDLANEIGGNDVLSALGGTTIVRAAIQSALDDVADDLRNRVPPILESHLVDVTQLRIPTMYGALSRLYRQNATTGGAEDIHARKASDYHKMHRSSLERLRPEVSSGRVAAPFGIAMHRR